MNIRFGLQGSARALRKGVVVAGMMSGLLFAASASAGQLYFNGFETNTSGWPSAPTRVASGTGGITSSTGAYHATLTGTNNTNFGGYNYGAGNNVATTFKDYRTSIDIYLDTAGTTNNDTRFDFTSAISSASGASARLCVQCRVLHRRR